MASRKILGVEVNGRTSEQRRSHPGHERSDPPLPPPPRRPYEQNLSPAPFEMKVRDLSEHPPPPVYRMRPQQPPPTDQAPAPTVVVQGHGWRVTLPFAAILSSLTAIGVSLASRGDSGEARQERLEEDSRRYRAEQDRTNAQLIQRIDRIESQQSLFDSRIEELRRKLRDIKDKE